MLLFFGGGDDEDWAHIFVCSWDFLGVVIAYDQGCARGILFDGHSFPMNSLCAKSVIYMIVYIVGHIIVHWRVSLTISMPTIGKLIIF